jgi:Spy/CpxP family protein refolding chaperone
MEKSWRVILAFVGIFAAGIVTGGLITFRFTPKRGEWRSQQNPAQRGQAGNVNRSQLQFGPQLLSRLTEQLELTEEQRKAIKPIETRTTEELRRLRRETQHNTELIIESMQDDISKELTPEQRVKFDEMIVKARERIKKFIQEQEQQWRQRRESKESGGPNRPRDGQPPPKEK